jgi:UDP-N-acetylmuramoylalanine--D-glutamate ligase
LETLKDFDVVFRSPGVRLDLPEIQERLRSGAVVTSHIRFFMKNCKAKMIGVTGSKGKGTTATLIHNIISKAGLKSFLVGNIGTPALDVYDQVGPEDYVVLELSSFQLQDIDLSPQIAVVLMVTADHLDYHGNVENYVNAKASITKYQTPEDAVVMNYDYENSRKIGEQGKAKKYYVQTLAEAAIQEHPFDMYVPERFAKIENGVFAEQRFGGIYLVKNEVPLEILNTRDLKLRGFHNVQNVGAAIAVADILKVPQTVIRDVVSVFNGLEHRLEYVTEVKGVRYYNDSIGTTPDSSIAAINSFNESVIALVGGADKGVDYEAFAEQLCKIKNLKGLVLIGSIASRIQDQIQKLEFKGFVLSGANSMSEAVAQAASIATEGDVVVLAPGTSSFDMFKDYKDRGNQFKESVIKN